MSDSFMTGRRAVRTIARMPPTSPVRADAIGVTVDDMDASLRFYRRCGFDVPADAGPDSPHVEIPLAGGFRLMLDAVAVTRSLHPDWTPPTGSSRLAIAIECTGPADVDATHADLVAASHPSHLEPFDAPWGQRYAAVLDPDGIGIDFYASLT